MLAGAALVALALTSVPAAAKLKPSPDSPAYVYLEARAAAERVLTDPTAPAVAQLRALIVAAPTAAMAGRTEEAHARATRGLWLVEHGTSESSVATDQLVDLDAAALLVASLSLAHRIGGRLREAHAIAEEQYSRL